MIPTIYLDKFKIITSTKLNKNTLVKKNNLLEIIGQLSDTKREAM